MVLKNAWIQYVSFFIVIGFLLYRLNSFVFRHKVINVRSFSIITYKYIANEIILSFLLAQLLHTYSTADIVYEKMD